ncbi:MAG: pyrroloquinoline quinone biosynthesis peptide chaperone PqqD [Pseudomonadota bacterium]
MITTSDIPCLPRGVRLHFDQVRDRWVLLAPERAIPLDQVGHAILQEVDGARSFGEITTALAEKYDAPVSQIQEDSAGFLNALKNRRFVDLVS